MADTEKLTSTQVPNPIRPRSFTNPDDVYDDVVGFDHPQATFQPGVFRPMWRVRPAAIQMNRVTTTQSQAAPTSSFIPPNYKTGVVAGPSTTSTSLLIVPDMSISLQTNGPVQVGFQITAQTVNANDPANFAIFRDGIQISPIFQQSGGANTNFTISQTIIDSPSNGTHVYALYWSRTASTLTAFAKARSIYAVNLKPI
jgi:hypothetical protein